MDQEIVRPAMQPKNTNQSFSPLGCFLSAAGATLLTLALLGTSAAASIWAIIKLWGLPDSLLVYAVALSQVPVLAATLWVMGRAWYVERRISSGLDVDKPVFKLMHYFNKG